MLRHWKHGPDVKITEMLNLLSQWGNKEQKLTVIPGSHFHKCDDNQGNYYSFSWVEECEREGKGLKGRTLGNGYILRWQEKKKSFQVKLTCVTGSKGGSFQSSLVKIVPYSKVTKRVSTEGEN